MRRMLTVDYLVVFVGFAGGKRAERWCYKRGRIGVVCRWRGWRGTFEGQLFEVGMDALVWYIAWQYLI